jgi:uncharacterized phage-like protein YoqJ
MIITATGHRPNVLGGYSPQITKKLRAFAREIVEELGPDRIVSGMALGWDQAVAWTAVDLKIPFTAAVPFRGQEKAWPATSQQEYSKLLYRSDEVVYVSPGGYAAWKMQARNVWMCNLLKPNRDLVLALWNKEAGGTANCVEYARSKDLVIWNVWDRWKELDA